MNIYYFLPIRAQESDILLWVYSSSCSGLNNNDKFLTPFLPHVITVDAVQDRWPFYKNLVSEVRKTFMAISTWRADIGRDL